MKTQYFKIRKERHEYLGERYFKCDFLSDHVIQVCMTCGDVKKGKGNHLGVYLIGKLTFFSNYLAQNYVQQVSKNDFEKQFKKVVELLS